MRPVARRPLPGLAVLFTAAFTTITTETLPTGLLPSMSRALHVPESRVGLLVGPAAERADPPPRRRVHPPVRQPARSTHRALRALPVRRSHRSSGGPGHHRQAARTRRRPSHQRPQAFTFLTPSETLANVFTPGTLSRLRDIKRDRDPHNTFRRNFPVLA
ncbi:hypothetical protein [Goodfellowiella coeruleoviolacea]|uniref:hypothetical protein n=1 Tax=Goodfellowiella coeruleoviolacea TaxID=334858 RepID=UPI0020A5E484|nr:hypothetical protein [Goodfellowiella coeruleoviolacea]